MKHIRNLWNLLKQEISLWKYEKQELVKGICYIVMIAWLFFDRIAFAILLIPYLFVFMKQQRIHKVHREKEKLRKEFREMMISIGNSLSAGYSIENALKTAKNDLEMYEEHSLLAKELQLLINKLKMNEPVDNLLFDMAEHVGLEEFYQFAQVISIAKKSGGNLIEITENTIEHLSQAIQTKEEIHTMIAAKQMEKKIMSVMPYFILLVCFFCKQYLCSACLLPVLSLKRIKRHYAVSNLISNDYCILIFLCKLHKFQNIFLQRKIFLKHSPDKIMEFIYYEYTLIIDGKIPWPFHV